MSVFDRYGNFVYLNDGSLSSEEEAEEEKKRQEQLCELMSMYQHYRGIVAEPQYVPRGSKLRCQYGTEFVQLDCFEDYGIYRGIWPLLRHWIADPKIYIILVHACVRKQIIVIGCL